MEGVSTHPAEVAADLLGEGFWRVGVPGVEPYFSPVFEEMLGYLPGELQGRDATLLSLLYGEETGELAAAIEGNRAVSMVARMQRADGRYSFIHLRGWPEQSFPPALIGTLARVDAVRPAQAEGNGHARKLLTETIESGLEAMLVLRAVRDTSGRPVDFEIVELNSKGASLLGVGRDEALGKLLGEVAPATREGGFANRYFQVMESGVQYEQEFNASPGGFQRISVRQRVVPLSDGVAVFSADVSQVRRTEDVADRSRRMFERIASTTPDLQAVWDLAARRFIYSNRNMFEVLGYESGSEAVVQGDMLERVLHPEDVHAFRDHLDALSRTSGDDVAEKSLRFRASNGEYRTFLFRDSVFDRMSDGRANTVLLTAQDVSDQRRHERELEGQMREMTAMKADLESRQKDLEFLNVRLADLATTDGLTGLQNHRAFQDRLSEEVERAQRYNLRLALVLADLDHFKEYNDKFGHPGGDRALKGFGVVLTEVSRSSDTVARYGGEEFAIILPNTGSEEAACLAERIQASLKGTEFGRQGVTASFGCAEVLPGKDAKEKLISEADRALYKSKSDGRNRISVAKGE